jgi:uncharacterized protein YndB with AHSA1/START domain
MSKTSATREIVIERTFDAPRELVWRALTQPEHLMRWASPKGCTSPVYQVDLRVGGKYLNCMRSPDGQDCWSTGIYREIVPPERLVYTDSFADPDGNPVPGSYYGWEMDGVDEMLVTITLAEVNGKTRLTLHHTGLPAGKHTDMMAQGWNELLDKLAATLPA